MVNQELCNLPSKASRQRIEAENQISAPLLTTGFDRVTFKPYKAASYAIRNRLQGMRRGPPPTARR